MVYGENDPPRYRELIAGLNLGRTRTLCHDPAYGLRQLANIAIQVIDRLEDIRLLAAYDVIARGLKPPMQPSITRRRDALLVQSSGLGAAARQPDALGLG